MRNRDSSSFGKRVEYLVMSELLRNQFDVYLTLVDDQAIDCIVRLDNNNYVDVQIKGRSRDGANWNRFGPLSIKPRENYFFIFYTEINDTFWVIPSTELDDLCQKRKSGKYEGARSLLLPRTDFDKKAELYKKYQNNFSLLRNVRVPNAVTLPE